MNGIAKVILIAISMFLVIFLLTSLIFAYFLLLHHYKGKEIIYNWSADDEFGLSDTVLVQKQPNKDFVILNLADVQMADLEDFFNRKIIHDEITYLINEAKPDLITLTGDQTWSNENLISLKSLISWLDEYQIPYAPVFGNHDYGNKKNSSVAELNYCCDLYEAGKYCLFRRGPSNIGSLGNYVVNIMEGNKIFKTLYMMDSGYEDKISDEQIAWFEWNANGIKSLNGGQYSEGMCFLHKPLPEYYTAYQKYRAGSPEVEAIGRVDVHFSLSGSLQNGFFDVAKDYGVRDVVCGHQHGNCFCIKYQDVRLTFALKTDELMSYYEDEEINLNGATKFILSQNNTEINNIYTKSGQFHIKNSNNTSEN